MKSTEIIANRKKLDTSINNYWNILVHENVIKKGQTRNYDMKELLKQIEKLGNDRMINKLDSLCVNLGFKSRGDFPKDSLYPIIYKLSERNEFYVRLGTIKTINSKLKTKLGKKNLNSTEELTESYINKLRENVQLEINALRKKLDDYNENYDLNIDDKYLFEV